MADELAVQIVTVRADGSIGNEGWIIDPATAAGLRSALGEPDYEGTTDSEGLKAITEAGSRHAVVAIAGEEGAASAAGED